MLSLCQSCGKLIGEGDRVKAEIESTFHVLKSTVTFALDKASMTCDPETLRHTNCNWPQGEPEYDGD